MATHHPEGCKRAPGGHIRYGVGSEPDGVLGGIGFTAASRQVGPRDRWIGGSADARIAPLGRVIRTHRFWLLPSVRVAGRASQVLRQAAPPVVRDWAETYGVQPGVLQTCVGPEHSGRSDRAAGWSCCPERTAGRRSGVARAVWVKPRVKDWRQTLCQDPNRRFGWSGPLATGDRWAERE